MLRISLACAVAVFGCVSASASAQTRANSKPAEVGTDSARAGTYELELSSDEGTIVVALDLKRVAGKLVPMLTVMGHTPDLKSFTRENNYYDLRVAMGASDVAYKLRFVRDSVYGSYVMSGDQDATGSLMGARKP